MKQKFTLSLVLVFVFLCFTGSAHAAWQIDVSEWRNWLCSSQPSWTPDEICYGPSLYGSFATEDECDEAMYNMAQEVGDQMLYEYSECVGYDEPPPPGTEADTTYQGNDTWSVSGPNTPKPNNRRQRSEGQLDEPRERRARAEFEQGKKEMLSRLKGGSGGSLDLKDGEGTLTLKPGNISSSGQGDAKAIRDLRNSVYWALKAARAVSNDNYEAAREFSEYSAQAHAGGDTELPAVPEVPPPVRAAPRMRLYSILIKEVTRTTSELKRIKTHLKQAEEKKRRSEQEIALQESKIEKLKQGETKLKEEDKQKEMDRLIADARALLEEAEKLYEEASKEIVKLNEQEKKQKENLNSLQDVFETAQKHPERSESLLKKLGREKK